MSGKFEGNSLVLATHNQGKVQEFSELFRPYNIEIISARDLNLPEPEEIGKTFEDNAVLKAKAAAEASGKVSLADDSGLCVYALNGDPGVYSARWAGKNKDFQKAMIDVNNLLGTNPDRRAAFVAVLAVVWPDGRTELFEGRCEGEIIWPPRGQEGFGYDPCFVPSGEQKSFAEAPELKARYAHRHKAFEKLASKLF